MWELKRIKSVSLLYYEYGATTFILMTFHISPFHSLSYFIWFYLFFSSILIISFHSFYMFDSICSSIISSYYWIQSREFNYHSIFILSFISTFYWYLYSHIISILILSQIWMSITFSSDMISVCYAFIISSQLISYSSIILWNGCSLESQSSLSLHLILFHSSFHSHF